MTRRLRRALARLLLLATLMAPISTTAEDRPGAAMTGGERLSSFHAALDDLQAGRRTRPVHVLQIGDSHTAGDLITGQLRARLQGRYGAGGRGVLPPGVPYLAYAPRQAQVTATGGWVIEQASPGGRWARPMGLSGMRAEVGPDGATLSVSVEPEAAFDVVSVCLAGGAPDSAIDVVAGPERRRLTAPDAGRAGCVEATFGAPQTMLDVRAASGSATIHSVATRRASGGVVLSNLGVIGTTVADLAARDDHIVAAELGGHAPDLIIVAYGSNEGFGPVDEGAYRLLFQGQLQRLKRLAPGAAILVLGPPDGATSRPDVFTDDSLAPRPFCAPLSDAETADYADRVARRDPGLVRWYPPMGLAQVARAQRAAAELEGAAYWDWSARMGGPCSSHALVTADPPRMRSDHLHFNSEGGAWIGDLLFADLMATAPAVAGAR